jgi:hypothetical protein
LIQRLALVDDRTFAEQPAKDHAGNLRTNVGCLISGNSAGKVLDYRRAALLDDDITDLGRAFSGAPAAATGSAGVLISASACAQQQNGREKGSGVAFYPEVQSNRHRAGTHFLLMPRIASRLPVGQRA